MPARLTFPVTDTVKYLKANKYKLKLDEIEKILQTCTDEHLKKYHKASCLGCPDLKICVKIFDDRCNLIESDYRIDYVNGKLLNGSVRKEALNPLVQQESF